jgi:hypothetical protein
MAKSRQAPPNDLQDRKQPDPLLRRGPASRMWITVASITMAAILAAVAISLWDSRQARNQNRAANQTRTLPIGPSKPAQPAQPTGRTSSHTATSGAGDTVRQ